MKQIIIFFFLTAFSFSSLANTFDCTLAKNGDIFRKQSIVINDDGQTELNLGSYEEYTFMAIYVDKLIWLFSMSGAITNTQAEELIEYTKSGDEIKLSCQVSN